MELVQYSLEVFEGPLDLLLKLISKNKVKIEDIPITLIFEQYMEHISQMRSMDMEIAGEFITMAAELMMIKSRMLLPRDDKNDEDPRAALAAALIEYKRMKEAAGMLAERFAVSSGRMTREGDELDVNAVLLPHDVQRLTSALERVLLRMSCSTVREEPIPPERMLEGMMRQRNAPFPVEAKVYGVMRRLRRGDTDFETLLTECSDRSEVIAAFVAVLELLRAQRVLIVDGADSEGNDDGFADDRGGMRLILHLNLERKTV